MIHYLTRYFVLGMMREAQDGGDPYYWCRAKCEFYRRDSSFFRLCCEHYRAALN